MTAPPLAFNKRGQGRHYRHPITDEEVPSITNIIDVLNKPAIPRWAAKLVAERAWDLRDTLEDLGKDEAIDILKGSPWRKSKRSADRGTSIHEYIEARAWDKPPPPLSGEAKQYQAAADEFLTAYNPEFHRTEFTVFGNGYAGTADFLATINGRLVLGDFKTGKDLYPEIALQLAAILNATAIVEPDGSERPLPDDIAGAVGVLLTPDGCDVRDINLDGAYEAFRGCLEAWHWSTNGVDMSPVLWGKPL